MIVLDTILQLAGALALLAKGQLLLATVFGSSSWDAGNPDSNLACYHREIDDRHDLVVAHNLLPCRTPLLLFNPRTGKSVVATVGDRGPRHADIDLSLRVAARIGHNGRERVMVVPLRRVPRRWSIRRVVGGARGGGSSSGTIDDKPVAPHPPPHRPPKPPQQRQPPRPPVVPDPAPPPPPKQREPPVMFSQQKEPT